MINLLIMCNDVNLTNALLDNISSKDLSNYDASCKTQISKFFQIKESDILFLNNETIGQYSSSYLKGCKNKLIYLSFDENKTLSRKTLVGITQLYQNYRNEKRRKIMAELEKVGYNFKYKGTQYLLETILEIQKGDIIALTSLQNNFYPIVAKKYNKTVHDVKNCIISATNAMYYECNIEKLKEYFHLLDDEKPSIKKVVYTIANRIYS